MSRFLIRSGVTVKLALEFVLLFIVLLIIGVLMQNKMNALVNSLTEQALTRQAITFSMLVEERFQREISELEQVARFLEAKSEPLPQSMRLINTRGAHVINGLFSKDPGVLYGLPLERKRFLYLRHAFTGRPVIDYAQGVGLLFAVPVFSSERRDNVSSVLYRLYEHNIVTESFGLSRYAPQSRILIKERNGKVILPYQGYAEEASFFEDEQIAEGYRFIAGQLQTRRAASTYVEGKPGRYFLFGTDLPQTNCTMIGYIPWEASAGGISRIYDLVLMVVSLLLVLFAIVSIYLFLMQSKAAESDALRQAKEQADKANRAKSDFLASMSHEIRTPINAVLGLNEIILRESHDPPIVEYARKISSAGHTLLSLINDILDFSKIESGRMELVETTYKLDQLLKDTIGIIEPKAAEKGLQFKVTVDETLPNELYGDMVRIRQVLINILNNAVKYTRQGYVHFTVGKKGSTEDTLALVFSIKDSGLGIRDEDKQRLFHDFERLDKVKNLNVEGTGLGLAISGKLVSLMHGGITVNSVYGQGSEFCIELPQRVVDPFVTIHEFSRDTLGQKEQLKSYQASFTAPSAKVLVVDDNEINLMVVKNLLKPTQVQVTLAQSGKECLSKICEESFDLILLDQMMPELDGVETLRKMRELSDSKCPEVPVVVLTAHAIAGAREQYLAFGFTDYLSKPIDPMKLEQMVLRYLSPDKVQTVTADSAPSESDSPETPASEAEDEIDVQLGLHYNGEMKDMYQTVLTMFSGYQAEKTRKMEGFKRAEDWKNYTILVHALKSSALTIGCRSLSEGARALEQAGKTLTDPDTGSAEKEQALEYLLANHDGVMQMYARVASKAGRLVVNS